MAEILHFSVTVFDENDNDSTKAIATPWVFSENSRAKNEFHLMGADLHIYGQLFEKRGRYTSAK